MALLSFFFFTFALTWTSWVAPAVLFERPRGPLFGIGGAVFLFGVFAPALVAVTMTVRAEGRGAVSRLLGRIGRWQVAARWYAFALGYMAATEFVAGLAHRLIRGDWPNVGEANVLLILRAILVSTWVQAGEEIGWRGYALPRLTAWLGLGPASVLLGVIWAAWHLPLFVLPESPSSGQSFPVYVLHIVAVSVAMAWLYWKTDASLLLMMIMHAAVNNTTSIFPAATPGAATTWSFDASFVAWAAVAWSWVVAAWLLFGMGRTRLDVR